MSKFLPIYIMVGLFLAIIYGLLIWVGCSALQAGFHGENGGYGGFAASIAGMLLITALLYDSYLKRTTK